MAGRAAVPDPQRRTWGGKTAGALGTAGDAPALGGTQTPHAVAPLSMPAAGGVRGCSTAAGAGSGWDEAGWRRGMTASSMQEGSPVAEARTPAAFQAEGSRCRQAQRTTATVAAGGGVAGRGRRPNGIDADLGHQGVSSPPTRPHPPRSRLPNGPEAPQRLRIPRPAARPEESTALPLFPAVGAPR